MQSSDSMLALLLLLGLATVAPLLLVQGQLCGAMTKAEPGDDYAKLQARTFENFRVECKANKRGNSEKPKCEYIFHLVNGS